MFFFLNNMNQAILQVDGMSCQHCVRAIEGALSGAMVKGQVNLEEGQVSVEYDPETVSLPTIEALIEDQGYAVVGKAG